MMRLLKGPLAVAMLVFGALAITTPLHVSLVSGRSTVPFDRTPLDAAALDWLSNLLTSPLLLFMSGGEIPGDLLVILRLATLALVAGGVFALAFSLTANRAVSIGTAVLFALHPVTRGSLIVVGDVAEGVTSLFLLVALTSARAEALRDPTRPPGGRGTIVRGTCGLLAGMASPVAVVGPVLVAFIESTAPPVTGARKRALQAAWPLVPGALIALAHPPATWPPDAYREGFGFTTAGFDLGAWTLVPIGSSLFVWAGVLGVLATLALAVRVRREARAGIERHALTHLAWVVGPIVLAGACTVGFRPALIGGVLLFLLPLGMIWRGLLRVLPEPIPMPDEPPFDLGGISSLGDAGEPAGRAHPGATGDEALLEQVRTTVLETMTTALVDPAVASGGATTSEAERRARLARERIRQRAARALPEAWNDADLERRAYRAHLRPWIARKTRVLELEPVGSDWTRQALADGADLVRAGAQLPALTATEADQPLLDVRLALPDLGALAAESFDLVLGHDALVRRPLPEAHALLSEIARVLRPGGRALVRFASLEAPRAQQQLEAEARGLLPEEDRGVQFMAHATIRMLCDGAGLRIDALHVGAFDRDSLLIACREVV